MEIPGMNQSPFELEIGDEIRLGPIAPPDIVTARYLGHFSTVYIVRSTDEVIPVTAIKTLRADRNTTEDARTAFTNEAILWTQLPNHPNILEAFYVSQYNFKPYIKMRYVSPVNSFGASLTDFLKGLGSGGSGGVNLGALSVDGTIYFSTQLLDVLSFLEQNVSGFCHGDIKPDNLLIDGIKENHPRLLLSDFGLSRALHFGLHTPPLFTGDVHYLAPETLEGERPGKLSDIYAVGCTIYEMLSGNHYQTYDYSKKKLIFTKPKQALKYIRTIHSSLPVPESLLELLFSCLKSEPRKRPQTFLELKERFLSAVVNSGGTHERIDLAKPLLPRYITTTSNNTLYKYLINEKKISPERAQAICLNIGRAANFRAAGAVPESEKIINSILQDLPGFAPAIVGKAHGWALLASAKQDHALYRLAITEYLNAISGYSADTRLISADNTAFGAACITLAQLLPAYLLNINAPMDVVLHSTQMAISLIKKGMEILPNESRLYLASGICLIAIADYRNALEILEEGYNLDKKNIIIKKYIVGLKMYLDIEEDVRILAEQYALTQDDFNGVRQMVSRWRSREWMPST
jgi:serine/threonine protein kinase